MSRQILCVVAASGLLFFAIAGASAATIDYRPALIPTNQPPVPVPLAIDPPFPTTADTITFSAPLDGEVYSNSCYAAKAFRGRPLVEIHEGDRTINISFDGVFAETCPEIYDPVVGVYGDFGTLSAGDWTFYNSHGGSLDFTVVPEPSSLILLLAGAVGVVAHRWRRTT